MVYRNIHRLIKLLRHKKFIGIDGISGSGKTYISNALSQQLQLPVLHVDAHLKKDIEDDESYIAHLKFEEITEFIKTHKTGFIIEGVCLLEVQKRLQFEPDVFIYVKRIDDRGKWLDKKECAKLSPEKVIKKIEKNLKKLGIVPSKIREFRKETIRYHAQYKPHTRDLIFEHYKN